MNTEFLDGLISKYGNKGVLIDANLLLMYLLGSYDLAAMRAFKRTQQYSREDWQMMERLTRRFKKMVTTPNVITEVSNLAGQLGEPIKTRFFSQMAKGVERLTEEYCPSLDACLHQYFAKCGVTDCAIMNTVGITIS